MAVTEPPRASTEAEILLGFLDHHRDIPRRKTEGLEPAGLAHHLAPSTMTLGGLLKHLALVEDWWLNQVFADNPEPEPWCSVDRTAWTSSRSAHIPGTRRGDTACAGSWSTWSRSTRATTGTPT